MSAAWRRFEPLLAELVDELLELRRPVRAMTTLSGPVARRMWQACHPFRTVYITPMAAVAGAVAQELIAFYARPGIARAAINNGGDIALYLTPDSSYRIGICTDVNTATPDAMRGTLRPDGDIEVAFDTPVRGIATSGWRGRSFSLGIADSVTVLAANAAQADAAATVIANAVNVDDHRIERAPACCLKDDSDLGTQPVTVDVPPLESHLVEQALATGLVRARELRDARLIWGALLTCQGRLAQLDGSDPRGVDGPAPGALLARFPHPSIASQTSRIYP